MSTSNKSTVETDTLPIDTPFWEGKPTFTNASLVISWEILQFFMEKTNGRLNFVYYAHLLATITTDHKSEMQRGIKVETNTCEAQLPVASLEALWGMKRKQGRNLLDRMEQLGLIKRTSDNVSSVVNLTNLWGIWTETRMFKNESHIHNVHELKLKNDLLLAQSKAEAKTAAEAKEKEVSPSPLSPNPPVGADKPQTATESPSEAISDGKEPTPPTSDAK